MTWIFAWLSAGRQTYTRHNTQQRNLYACLLFAPRYSNSFMVLWVFGRWRDIVGDYQPAAECVYYNWNGIVMLSTRARSICKFLLQLSLSKVDLVDFISLYISAGYIRQWCVLLWVKESIIAPIHTHDLVNNVILLDLISF